MKDSFVRHFTFDYIASPRYRLDICVTMVSLARISAILFAFTFVCTSLSAQTPPTDRLNAKALEAAATYSQSLAQWCFIIIGGSLVLFIGNSHRWPKRPILRYVYLLFVIAWVSLTISIYLGTRVQQAYLAYELLSKTTLQGQTDALNADLAGQISWMFSGLFFLFVWVVFYVVWSVVRKENEPQTEDPC